MVDSMCVGILAWCSLSSWFLCCRRVLLHPRVDEPSYSRTSFSSLHLWTNTLLSLFNVPMKDSVLVDFAGTWECSASRMELLMWSVSSSYLQLPPCLPPRWWWGWAIMAPNDGIAKRYSSETCWICVLFVENGCVAVVWELFIFLKVGSWSLL